MRSALFALFLLVPAAVWAQDVPDQQNVRQYVETVQGAEQDTLTVGPMQVEVTLILDYFSYLVAKDYAELDLGDEPSGKTVAEKVKRLASKHVKHKNKTAILMRFRQPQHSPLGGRCNLIALEGKIIKKIRITQVGRGKQRFTVVDSEGKPKIQKLTLFQAQSSRLFRGDNVPPIIKRAYLFLPKEYSLDIELKKPVHERTKKIKVSVGGMIHFSGSSSGTQMDFSRGALADYVKGGEVEFRIPSPEPVELPAALSKLLK